MGKSPEELRHEIEQTRRELSQDVDALTEKVSPGRVMSRRVDKARGAVSDVRDRVMGSASGVASGAKDSVFGAKEAVSGGAKDSVFGAKDSANSLASSVGETVTGAPATVKQKAQGNPLAAGLIAFGAGWLLSSLLPATAAEQKVAGKAKDAAAPLVEQASQAAQEIAGNLKEPAQEAAEMLKMSASDAASTVKEESKSATGSVAQDAKGSADSVKEARSS